ncbi:MAG TPA: hypothetical protein VFN61_04555 [Acidimicrobiales bacterium]|nr:hypothetical protein [Acidimicrobiales bacterium]
MPTGRVGPANTAALTRAAAQAANQMGALDPGTFIGRRNAKLSGQEGNPASGQCQLALPVPPDGTVWQVELIDLSSTSTVACSVSVQLDGWEVDFTTAGQHDAADYNPAIWVPSGSQLTINWTALSGASKCYAYVQYRAEVG